jgi:hypothetical protein
MWERFKPIFFTVSTISGIAGIIGRKNIDAIVDRYLPSSLQGSGFSTILLFLLTLALAYCAVLSILFRRIPVHVLKTVGALRFRDPDGKDVEVQRTRLLRANRPGVKAVFVQVTPDAPGRIEQHDVLADARTGTGNLKTNLELIGRPEEGWTLIVAFAEPLPYRWYLPLIPRGMLRFVWQHAPRSGLRKLLVELDNTALYRNDFNRADPCLELQGIAAYPQQEVVFDLHFHPDRRPATRDVRARLFLPYSVEDLEVRTVNNGSGLFYRIELHDLVAEKLRITWLLPPSVGAQNNTPSIGSGQQGP